MSASPTTTLCLLALSVVLAAVSVKGGLDTDRVRLIDVSASGSNFLFRGNEPVSSKTFQWDLLTTTMASVAGAANRTMPSTFRIIDVCLLNVAEYGDMHVEEEYFEKNPTHGTFVNWPTIGSLIDPQVMTNNMTELEHLAKTLDSWSFDKVPDRMQELYAMLNKPYDVPTALYIHCEAGEDRTGEMSGSYYMKHLNWTYAEALTYDNHIEKRNIKWMSKNGLAWYCFFLKYAEGQSSRDCMDPPPSAGRLSIPAKK